MRRDATTNTDSVSYRTREGVWRGAAGAATTTTSKAEVYAFFFGQKGLMAGLGLQGTKITKITK